MVLVITLLQDRLLQYRFSFLVQQRFMSSFSDFTSTHHSHYHFSISSSAFCSPSSFLDFTSRTRQLSQFAFFALFRHPMFHQHQPLRLIGLTIRYASGTWGFGLFLHVIYSRRSLPCPNLRTTYVPSYLLSLVCVSSSTLQSLS
jgi:hypothetical protein